MSEELPEWVSECYRNCQSYPKRPVKNSCDELINNIKNLQRKIGSDYLDIILKRISAIDHDIIIAVENKKEE